MRSLCAQFQGLQYNSISPVYNSLHIPGGVIVGTVYMNGIAI